MGFLVQGAELSSESQTQGSYLWTLRIGLRDNGPAADPGQITYPSEAGVLVCEVRVMISQRGWQD